MKFLSQENYPLRSASTTEINSIPSRSKTFKKAFFSYFINEWNILKPEITVPFGVAGENRFNDLCSMILQELDLSAIVFQL